MNLLNLNLRLFLAKLYYHVPPRGPKKDEQNIDHDLDKDDAYDHDHYQGHKYMLVLSTEA